MNISTFSAPTTSCLLNEPPLVVSPSLAVALGLNEAIVVQQVHYWVEHNRRTQSERHFHEGRYWTYNTAEDWQAKNFPFWSIQTVRRIFNGLEKSGILLAGNFNSHPTDKTKWTTIDYVALNQSLRVISPFDQSDQMEVINLIKSSDQLDQTIRSNWVDDLYTETTPETTPENSSSLILEPTTTAIFPEPTEPAPQRLTAVPSQNPFSSSSVSAAPVMQGVGSAAATRETQLETTPPRDQFGRPQRNASLVPPLQPVQVGNGTPWLPMAPWTSKEEHDEFAAYLHRSFPGKPEGYYHKIIDRVGKGDFENRSWLAFKAGNSPESMGAALSIPDEWKRLLEAEQRAVSESNPQWSEIDCQLRGLNNFRGKFTYCRNGQESKLGQAADDWALGLLNALKAQSAA